MEYQQHDQNSFCFSSLASALKALNKLAAVNATATIIYTSLTYAIPDGIKFENSIMSDQTRNFGEQHIHYKLEQ